ncbi:MAG TPA: hypothetical protein VFD92_16545 [Candidatus Binatia bacterium]|nr:hypothetical protein [Candidatus Binatia bacterium]
MLDFYVATSAAARSGALRNPAPELAGMELAPDDLPALERFLESLNADDS